MTVYVIVQLKMTDRAAYDRYQAQFFDVFKKFEGRLLSADESPAVLEGTWDRDKVVLMSFPGETAFKAWANSPEYLEISKDRKAGAQGVVLLAQGLAPGRCGLGCSGPPGPEIEPEHERRRRLIWIRPVVVRPVVVSRRVWWAIGVDVTRTPMRKARSWLG